MSHWLFIFSRFHVPAMAESVFMYVLLFVMSMMVSAVTVPPIIRLAMIKRLFDVPLEDRKVHKKLIPNLGGLAIILGTVLSFSLVADSYLFEKAGIILAGGVIISSVGLKDNLVGMTPFKKFAAQFAAAMLVCVLADMRIKNFFGIFGIEELSYLPSILLSIFSMVGIINAFNLIDGIDGLAGGIALTVSVAYSFLFGLSGDWGWSYLAFALAGGVAGFLVYNKSPARIFMGDTGALFIGFMISLFSIRFLETRQEGDVLSQWVSLDVSPALAASIIIVPLFDTLRVFTIRILNSESPFKADRNHIHHKLLDIGFSHTKAAGSLVLATIFFIGFTLLLQNVGVFQVLMSLVIMVSLTNTLLTLYVNSRQEKLNKEAIAKGKRTTSMDDEKVFESILHRISEN